MQNDLFRKKSLESIESPDELNRYIKVTNPGVWILIVAIVVILIGGCIWGIFGKLNTVVQGGCYVENGELYCIVNEADGKKLKPGMEVKIGEIEGVITYVDRMPRKYGSVVKKYNYSVSQKEYNKKVICFTAEADITDGFYYMDVIIESKSPFSFLLNS